MRLALHCHEEGIVAVVDEHELEPGTRLDGRFGLTGRVCERLLRIIALLALRRIGGIADGWTTASEIAALVDRTDRAAIPSASGVAKFLERRLDARDAMGGSGRPVLIQHELHKLSTGPYRLDIESDRIEIVDCSAHGGSVLMGNDAMLTQGLLWAGTMKDASLPRAWRDGLDIESALAISDDEFRQANIFSARHVVALAVHEMKRGRWTREVKAALEIQALAFERIAYLDMSLGQSSLAAQGASRALGLYRRLKARDGVARVHQISAHAHRQLGQYAEAVRFARMGHRASKHSRRTTRGTAKAGFLGLLGQQLTYGGAGWMAVTPLEQALALTQDAGDRRWTVCWHLRLVENALSMADIGRADHHLDRALELQTALPQDDVPHQAVLYRISAQFFLATGAVAEARAMIRRAHDIGMAHAMSYQIRMMAPLLRHLQEEQP